MDYNRLKHEIKEIVDVADSVPEAFRQKCFELLLNNLLTGKGISTETHHKPDVDQKPPANVQQGLLPLSTQLETVASQQNRLVVKAFVKRSYVTVMSLRITRLINAAMHRWVNACEKILSLLSPYHVDSRLSATLLQSPQLRVFMQKTEITEDELKAILMVADGDVHFVKEPAPTKITDGQMQWAFLLALKNCILSNSLAVDPEDVRSVCQDKGFYDAANFAANFKKDRYAKFFKGPMERQGEPQLLTNDGQDELANLIRTMGGAKQ